MKEFTVYLVMIAVIIGLTWGAATLWGWMVSDHEIIEPEDGVRCVVVSRVLNTSVSCWRSEDD